MPQRVERARPVAGDEHVADGEQLVEQLLPVGLAQVERDAPLVAADALPHQPDAVLALAPRAHRVADARLLDLDHLGTELAERRADHRPGGQRRRLDRPGCPSSGPGRSGTWTTSGRGRPSVSRRVLPGVGRAEALAALELGHDVAHDVLVRARRVGGGDDEAVARVGLEPLLHLVGDVGAGARRSAGPCSRVARWPARSPSVTVPPRWLRRFCTSPRMPDTDSISSSVTGSSSS